MDKYAIRQLVLKYFKEILDAFIAITLVSYISPKIKFEQDKVIKTSIMIGTITFLLEYYDETLQKTCKSSMFYSLGNSWA